MMQFMFGQRPTVEDHVRKWKSEIDKQKRDLDRQAQTIIREEKKTTQQIKAHARAGQISSAKLLARELVRSRASRARLTKIKTQLGAIQNKLTESLTMAKLGGAFKKSTEIMRLMNRVCNLPEMAASMAAMEKEMSAQELIAEGMDDLFEDMDDEAVDDETDEAIDRVFDELTMELHEETPAVRNNRVRIGILDPPEGTFADSPITDTASLKDFQ